MSIELCNSSPSRCDLTHHNTHTHTHTHTHRNSHRGVYPILTYFLLSSPLQNVYRKVAVTALRREAELNGRARQFSRRGIYRFESADRSLPVTLPMSLLPSNVQRGGSQAGPLSGAGGISSVAGISTTPGEVGDTSAAEVGQTAGTGVGVGVGLSSLLRVDSSVTSPQRNGRIGAARVGSVGSGGGGGGGRGHQSLSNSMHASPPNVPLRELLQIFRETIGYDIPAIVPEQEPLTKKVRVAQQDNAFMVSRAAQFNRLETVVHRIDSVLCITSNRGGGNGVDGGGGGDTEDALAKGFNQEAVHEQESQAEEEAEEEAEKMVKKQDMFSRDDEEPVRT